MPRHIDNPVDPGPFLAWFEARIEAVAVQEDGRKPSSVVFSELGWTNEDSAARRIYRYRHGGMAQRLELHKALDRAGVELELVYPEFWVPDVELEDESYCWVCRAFVTPIRAACPWCEHPIEHVDLSALPSREQLLREPQRMVALVVKYKPRKPKGVKEVLYDTHLEARRKVLEHYVRHGSRLHAGQLALDMGVPFASAESAAGALLALLRREGWTRGRYKGSRAAVKRALKDGTWDSLRDPGLPAGGRRCISEALIREALWLYFYEEISFGQIAERIFTRTTAKSPNVVKRQLNVEWNQRGWPRRTFHEAGRLRGYAPPAEDRRCREFSRNGKPCRRWAIAGERYCVGHHPDRREQRLEMATKASQVAYMDAVPAAPFGWWVRARAKELGSVAAVHRRIGAEVVSYWSFVQWASPWQEGPGQSGHKGRGQVIRRSTIDRILEAWGDGTTFEDVYLPVTDDEERVLGSIA